MNWKAIKTEYITDESSSYRKLAEKYKVSFNTLQQRAAREKWADEKKRYQDELVEKRLEKNTTKETKRIERIQNITDKLLDKLEQAVAEVEPADTQAIRQITASIKDIKEIKMLRSEMDRREQQARIANLERQAEADNTDSNITVTFDTEKGEQKWAE